MKNLELSPRYKIGKILVIVLIILCVLFMVFMFFNFLFKIVPAMDDKEAYIAIFIVFTIVIIVMLFGLRICFEKAVVDKGNNTLMVTNVYKKTKSISLANISAKVYLSKTNSKQKVEVDFLNGEFLVIKIFINKDGFQKELSEIGIKHFFSI